MTTDPQPPSAAAGGSAIKAWSVTADSAEASIIAFAEKVSEAKAIAKGSEWLCEFDFTELRAVRLPEADEYVSLGVRRLDGSCSNSARVMYELGWRCVEGSDNMCDGCGRYEWDGVPESTTTLHGDEDIGERLCPACAESLKQNNQADQRP